MFSPKRIYVKPQSRTSPKAKEIIARAKSLDPTVQIINLRTKDFEYPAGLSPKAKFLHMKESVILSERVEPFIKTFPSPGKIVEDLNTVLNYTWMCPLNCEFCYLQTNQTPEHYFYTNLRDLEREFATASHAHKAILTIWSMLSIAKKHTFLKIPSGLEEYSDKLREEFSQKRIAEKKRIVDWLFIRQAKIYEHLKGEQSSAAFGIEKKEFRFTREEIERLFDRNATHRLRMIPSEFCDMVAVDHLTGNLRHLAQQVAKAPDVDIEIRTKASQLDDIRSFSGNGRITFAIGLNTDYVISKYEHGTASLDERLSAARTVQEADGYGLDLVIEPLIKYEDCMQDYVELVGRIANAVDLTKVRKISLGSVRYRKQLRARIKRNFPKTDLFFSTHELQEPEKGDFRLRYSLDYLTEAYTSIQKELTRHASVPISLGAEKPELWQRMQLSAGEHLSKSVYQFSETTMAKKQSKSKPAKEVEPKKVEQWAITEDDGIDEDQRSIFYKCALIGLADAQHDIDVDQFDGAEEQLNHLEYTDEPFTAQDGTAVLGSFDLWDTIDPVTIKTARSPENLWRPVKIAGRLISLTEAKPANITINAKETTVPTRILMFQDKERQKFQTLVFPESSMPAHLDQLLRSQKLVTLLGCAVFVETNKEYLYRFYVRKLVDNTPMSELVVRPKSDEFNPEFVLTNRDGVQTGIPVNHPFLLVDRYGYSERRRREGKELFNFIKNSMMQNLKILGVEHGANHLERGLEFVILQALSQGNSDGFSNKLHGLIIGPPNVGKSKLTDAAKAINPIFNEMSVVGAKQTAAGAIGKVKEVKGVALSTGGIFPSTSGGAVCIQDFHLLEGGARKTFFKICSLLMEKGTVRDDTSVNATLEAEVSLLVYTNRRHQVEKDHPPKPYSYADLDIPINILSRFDFILEIPKDTARQDQVSDQMGLTSATTTTLWESEIKDLIAFLRDHYDDVVVSKEVSKYAGTELQKLFDEYKSVNFEENIEDHRIRIQRSLKKYTIAIARAWAHPVVSKDHIDFVMNLIREKVSFLAKQSYGDSETDRRSVKKQGRKKLILEHFEKRVFTTAEAKAFYAKEFPKIASRNVQRDLDALKDAGLIIPVKHGHWQVVSSEEPAVPQKTETVKKKTSAKSLDKKRVVKRKK